LRAPRSEEVAFVLLESGGIARDVPIGSAALFVVDLVSFFARSKQDQLRFNLTVLKKRNSR
jgi:hypothetical protein